MKFKGLGLASLAAVSISSPVFAELPQLEFGGLVEVEAASSEDFAGAKTADVTLATVEVAMDATLNEHVSAHIAFLYEEGKTDFGLDEGTVTLGLNDSVAFTAGKMYVPFGRFDSFMISDPQTLTMAETTETVLMLSAENNGFQGSAYLFNGVARDASTAQAGNNDDISAGFDIGYVRDGLLDVGASYITNIADSNTLQELKSTTAGTNAGVVDSSVAGASAYFSVNVGKVTILGEHVTALKSFHNGDLDSKVTREEKPSASNIEIGVGVTDKLTLAAAYQKTSQAYFIGLPETVVSASASYKVMEGATLAGEFASSNDYGTGDGGTGKDARSFTMQLAVEF